MWVVACLCSRNDFLRRWLNCFGAPRIAPESIRTLCTKVYVVMTFKKLYKFDELEQLVSW